MKYLSLLGLVTLMFGSIISCNAAPADESVYWRFEKGSLDKPIQSMLDESGNTAAVYQSGKTSWSDMVSMALIPGTSAPNHGSLKLDGGYLIANPNPILNARTFTVELWARFNGIGSIGQVLVSKGVSGAGNWHIIYQADGSVRANIYGGTEAMLFEAGSQGPAPGVWYHLAAVYEDIGDGKTRISAYVNGHLRSSKVGAMLRDTSGSDLVIGAHGGGEVPFYGCIDELRFTPRALKSNELLIGSPVKIEVLSNIRKPYFVPAGTRITTDMIAKSSKRPIIAKPDGYKYFHKYINGLPVWYSLPDGMWDDGFRSAMMGISCGSPVGYHLYVKPGGKYAVAVGFYKPNSQKGQWPQKVVVDGKIVDTLDPSIEARDKPIVRIYDADDANRDGILDVSCSHIPDETGPLPIINVIWVFDRSMRNQITPDALVHGEYPVPPIYYIDCGNEEQLAGHVEYMTISDEPRKKMLPERPLMLGMKSNLPKMPDPLDITIKGDLADRINTFLDRWGSAGRDQKIPAGFLSDCGYEVAGRYLDAMGKLGRLMRKDFDLLVPFEALLEKQDTRTKYPGSFIGGTPLRTGFIWGQSTVFTGLMEYYDSTGDKRALDAADKLADWYISYLDNGDLAAANYFADDSRFSRDGATVGHLGKGVLEAMVWCYWRTGNEKYLNIAKRMAELNRQWGGVAWMINGDLPPDRQQYEGWHIHANMTMVRGFPWLYAATGDISYLNDAKAACDRVYERATWGTGGVLEQIPWAGTAFPGAQPDPHDETCQTADLMQLSYLIFDYTGDMKYFDRAEKIYYNHIRYEQLHNGSFMGFTRLPGPERSGDAWFCCGWWGAKAMYETARHLYASTSTGIYVRGYLPSDVTLRLEDNAVTLKTMADMPKSGDVRITVNPEHEAQFNVFLRIPSWALLKRLRVNGVKIDAKTVDGFAVISRMWDAGDRIDISFGLPLRAELDSTWDTLPTAKVSVDGDEPVEARYLNVFRGPMIIARFMLNHGCDLSWAYTEDHPDMFDVNGSVADVIEASGWSFRSDKSPSIVTVSTGKDAVKLQWESSPSEGWKLIGSAVVHNSAPAGIDFASELIAPSEKALASVKSVRLAGMRMKTSGYIDFGKATLTSNRRKVKMDGASEASLPAGSAVIDNGFVQFRIKSRTGDMLGVNDGSRAGIYILPKADGNSLKASYQMQITGKSAWSAPLISPFVK